MVVSYFHKYIAQLFFADASVINLHKYQDIHLLEWLHYILRYITFSLAAAFNVLIYANTIIH